MSPKQSFEVAGVDGCKGGWFAAIAEVIKQADGNCSFKLKSFFVANTFTEVVRKTNDCKLICIDIPIGLSDGNRPRKCDAAARKILTRSRASSIFPPPIRPCLCAKNYKQANKISLRYCGKKLSKQSYFILDKIRQVDDLMTADLQNRVHEIHPEISFWSLNSKKSMRYNKKTPDGRNERMKLLNSIFPNVENIVGKAQKPNKVAPDDIVDALVGSWTAGQAVLGKSKTLPENPEFDSKDLRMEILYPISYNE